MYIVGLNIDDFYHNLVRLLKLPSQYETMVSRS